jgi:hypothetical protein
MVKLYFTSVTVGVKLKLLKEILQSWSTAVARHEGGVTTRQLFVHHNTEYR